VTDGSLYPIFFTPILVITPYHTHSYPYSYQGRYYSMEGRERRDNPDNSPSLYPPIYHLLPASLTLAPLNPPYPYHHLLESTGSPLPPFIRIHRLLHPRESIEDPLIQEMGGRIVGKDSLAGEIQVGMKRNRGSLIIPSRIKKGIRLEAINKAL